MTVPNPTVLVAISEHSLHITRTDRQEVYDSMGLDLATLGKEGYMGACHTLSNIIMRMLADVHPQVFAAYPALVPPTAANNPAALALGLMKLSLEHNTGDYVDAVDALLRHHAGTIAHTGLAAQWKVNRERLLRILGS